MIFVDTIRKTVPTPFGEMSYSVRRVGIGRLHVGLADKPFRLWRDPDDDLIGEVFHWYRYQTGAWHIRFLWFFIGVKPR